MSTLSSALTALAGPLAKKVLSSLGIGFLTYAGLDTAVSYGLGLAKSSLAGLSGDIAQIAAMSGLFTALSVIAGGIVASLAMVSLTRLAKLT